MPTGRLEAFSDGVLAIIITVMVLELKIPEEENTFHALWHTSGLGLLTYLISFVYVGIYWNNHHHLFQICTKVDGAVLWANLVLLFALSLFPFTTNWMDESHLARDPVIVYALNLALAGAAYFGLQHVIARVPGQGQRMREVYGRTAREAMSLVLYGTAIALALIEPWLGLIPFGIVAGMWLVPDRRVERYLEQNGYPDRPSSAGESQIRG